MLPAKQGLYNPEFEHDNCGAGFICSLQGKKTNDIIHKALDILDKLEHRGAVSADGKTGDGAGILIEIPHDFLVTNCDFELPELHQYAVGMVFLPKKENQRTYSIGVFESEIKKQGLEVLGWRKVPVNPEVMGSIAAQTEPYIMQIFIGRGDKDLSDHEFNIKLFIARKIAEHTILSSKLSQASYFYLPSLSTHTLIYKGLLIPEDIKGYYQDLSDPAVVTRLALVHQRFSTNTFPTWDLAQPFRYMCHNGEINTFRGNLSRMQVREELLESDLFGSDIKKILPVILKGKSDSSSMDMVVELLLATGRSLPEVMMMLVPEAWEKHTAMDDNKKAFYKYNACIMEPWDGPASIPFTDGKYIGALLDRNGLRPSRYSVTKDGYVVMSSETGVLDIAPENIERHGRLEPGKMFLVNMDEGRIIEDDEIKNEVTTKRPYKKWLNENQLPLKEVPYTGNVTPTEKEDFETRMRRYFVLPYTIGDYLSDDIRTGPISTESAEFKESEENVKQLLTKLVENKGKHSVDYYHKKLGNIMWDKCGMSRNETGLNEAISEIKELRADFWKNVMVPGGLNELNKELEKAGRVADFLELGELFAKDALTRNESCGGHFREEYATKEGEAKRDDKKFNFVSAWEYKGEPSEAKLHKEKLEFENIEVKVRSYK